MAYRYEIDSQNTVRIWDDANPTATGAPFFLQDVHPDGRAWADREEAQAWVDAFIIELTNPPAPSVRQWG